MTYWQNSGLIRLKGNPNSSRRGNNRNGEKTFQCAGCFYNILWYGANEANGKYYCGGCNADLAEPGNRVEWEKPTQEQPTFTDNYESEGDKKEKKKKKEKPNLKPVEEDDNDIFGDIDLKELTEEEKEQEAQKYFNNKAFKIWLKKYKFVASMPYHLFRGDLNAMRNYWKEWNKWKGETNIPKPSKPSKPSKNWNDYYEILGIDETADKEELKQAYKNLSLKYHPDKNIGDKEAEAKFKEISEAYQILKDIIS